MPPSPSPLLASAPTGGDAPSAAGAGAPALAEHIVREYAADLAGGAGEALRAVVDRLVLDGAEAGADRWQAIARMRGPYLQALRPPDWSDRPLPRFAAEVRGAFAPEGLRPELQEVLDRRGVRRLYRFQEEAMAAALDDRDLLITAATGRGKTEAWLLPLLQHALLAKDGLLPGEAPVGTKALLLYPTKALAQDQFRRIISSLVSVNRLRPPERRVTVGILTGDTPHGSRPGDQNYLFEAFRLVDCPVDDGDRCPTCPRNLAVLPRGLGDGRFTLCLPEPACERRVPLDFVVLTRRDMLAEQPDLVITDPDILHQRLLNVNDDRWRQILIDAPRFLVLDEIHTYAGTFGATVAWIIRRLRAARRAAGSARPLRVIGASATVANGADLFARIAGVDAAGAALVAEAPAALPPRAAPAADGAVPAAFARDRWGERPPAAWLADPDLAAALGGAPAGGTAALGEELLARLVPADGSAPPAGLAFVRGCYEELARGATTPGELRRRVGAAHPRSDATAVEVGLANALAVATAAGLLESRTHLFCWPVDGYYGCLACGAVYLEPRAACRCGGRFVTRAVSCTAGDELAAEGWLCPACLDVVPFLATVDGQFVAFDPPTCAAGHAPVDRVRVVWRPYGRCPGCGRFGKQGDVCPECGATVDWPGGPAAGPGGTGGPALRLPWVCLRCGALHPTVDPPGACRSCGRGRFVVGALAEARSSERCPDCAADFLPGRGCRRPGHAPGTDGAERDRYSLVEADGRLLNPRDHRAAVPCYHPRATYELHRRFASLSRSPANVAVTSAQAALRRVAGAGVAPDGTPALDGAKMLSFSDSQADMEQLARDFNDPEQDTFVDQAVFGALADGPAPLAAVVERVVAAVPPERRRGREGQGRAWERRVLGRFVRGRGGGFGPAALAAHGLADLRWTDLPAGADEQEVLAELLGFNGQDRRRLRQELGWTAERFAAAVGGLARGGWAAVVGEVCWLELGHLEARLVGPAAPAWRRPTGGFVLSAVQQVAPLGQVEPYAVAAAARTDPDGPDFSRVARRVFSTARPVLLQAEAYKGSTEAARRRQLEYRFARRESPNFLSSGPAMEVGIDIGDLDRVLLYGTPPNINGYLQRIGRAGRRSKQALVVSVSKRNPIDLYYYRNPLGLIESSAQPVPLQEHSPRVVEAALSLAVLDYVAAHWTFPWRRSDDGGDLVCDGVAARRGAAIAGTARPLTWLQVLRTATDAVGEDVLVSLEDLVAAQADEVRAYLDAILDYGVCGRCGRPAPAGAGRCPCPGCGGAVTPAAVRFADLAEAAVAEFAERIVRAPHATLERYDGERRRLKRRSLELEDAAADRRGPGRAAAERERRQVDDQLALVLALENAARRATLLDNHERSPAARFGYGIRGIDDQVAAELVSGGLDEPQVKTLARAVGPALREFAPGALTLQDGTEYVTLAVLPDDGRTADLHRRLAEAGRGQVRACRRCAAVFEPAGGRACPSCGGPSAPAERLVPGRARAFARDEGLRPDPRDTGKRLFPSHAFRNGDAATRIENTFVRGGTELLGFRPTRAARVLDGAGAEVGELAVGDLELLSTADAVSATYETGEREPRPRLFELCGHPGCGGLIAPAVGGVAGFCMLDPSHDEAGRRVVQLVSHVATVGARLVGPAPRPDGHSLLHGLRAGLEKVAGVLVRDVGEVVTADAAYLFDAATGGAGVTELLLDPADGWRHFRTALEVAAELARCPCDDGCPLCLFQYGCAERNAPATLSRRALWAWLARDLRLEEVGPPTGAPSTVETPGVVAAGG